VNLIQQNKFDNWSTVGKMTDHCQMAINLRPNIDIFLLLLAKKNSFDVSELGVEIEQFI